jgi:hypothetical protein
MADDDKTDAKPETEAPKPAEGRAKRGTATITFIGDPNKEAPNPKKPDFNGKAFPLNEPVVVDDKPWLALNLDKLRRHSHFRVE